VAGGWRRLHNVELHNLYSAPNTVRVIKSRKLRWAGHEARIGEINAYTIFEVGIALGYGLDDRDSRVRFPVGARNFSLHHRVQNGSGAHPAS
jgi:hypothetical protein